VLPPILGLRSVTTTPSSTDQSLSLSLSLFLSLSLQAHNTQHTAGRAVFPLLFHKSHNQHSPNPPPPAAVAAAAWDPRHQRDPPQPLVPVVGTHQWQRDNRVSLVWEVVDHSVIWDCWCLEKQCSTQYGRGVHRHSPT